MQTEPHFVPERESLRRLLKVAAAEFPDPEQQRRIRDYVRELSHLMPVCIERAESQESARAEATSAATGEDVVSLLCKLEDYLESAMVGLAAKKIGR
jgi:hypothetical protein